MPKLLSNKGIGCFLSGVLSLSASTVIVKIIGLVYKIPMLRLVGGEGMGYFNSAYEIYSLLCIVSITGLPVAMSVIISGTNDRSRWESVLSLSLKLFTAVGVILSVSLVVFSGQISLYLRSEKALYCILAISPSIALVCMGSAYKGYFQGLSDMKPICISGIIEAASKLIFGLLLSWIAVYLGYEKHIVAAFGVLGITMGSLISLLYFIIYKRRRNTAHAPRLCLSVRRRILADIIKISVPATLSSMIISLTRVVDMIMILRRLQDIGYTSESANAIYGSYTTMAIPIFSLAAALVSSVAIPLIPSLSKSVSDGDIAGQRERIECAISLTAFIACPAMIGISLFSREILELIFKNQADGVALTAPLLGALGLSVLISVLITLTSAMLQAYRRATLPIISMLLGCAIKLVISYVLIGTPDINILGAPIGTFFCDLAICVLNFVFLSRCSPSGISFSRVMLRPVLCSAGAILPPFFVMRALQTRFDGDFITVLCIGLAGGLYLIFSGRQIIKLKDLE